MVMEWVKLRMVGGNGMEEIRMEGRKEMGEI